MKTADSTGVAGAKVRIQRGTPFYGDAPKTPKDTTVTTNSRVTRIFNRIGNRNRALMKPARLSTSRE